MQGAINVRSRMLARQILAKTRNSPNPPNVIARQNLLIYSTTTVMIQCHGQGSSTMHKKHYPPGNYHAGHF